MQRVKFMQPRSLVTTCLVATVLGAVAVAEEPTFVFRDLSTLGGYKTVANAVNNSGQVVGWSQAVVMPDGALPGPYYLNHAFLWENGEIRDLETLGGASSEALDINEQGVIVGTSLNHLREPRAFLFWEGTMYDLNDLLLLHEADGPPPIVVTEATGINDENFIVGNGFVGGNPYLQAWMLVPKLDFFGATFAPPSFSIIPLGSLAPGVDTLARDINGSNEVIGVSGKLAFLWANYEMLGLETDWQCGANAINDQATVAGWVALEGGDCACIWHRGRADLEALRGWTTEARSLNDHGSVVGEGRFTGSPFTEALIWIDHELFFLDELTLLPDAEGDGSSIALTRANGINDLNRVVGVWMTPQGHQRGYLLTPQGR